MLRQTSRRFIETASYKIATTDRSLNVRPTLSTVYVVSKKITEKNWLIVFVSVSLLSKAVLRIRR